MATDQEIRDAGFKYIPQQQYLQNPFEIPTAPEAPVVNQGIVNTNAFTGGGGDNFSVYNMDPNRISNMNANKYALQDARRENELSYVGSPIAGYTTDTEAMKNMERYPKYYGLDAAARKDKEPTKFQEFISRGIDFIPGIGIVKKGADFLSNIISPYMPINRRAIMENQLGVGGVMVDDIGRIVVGQGGDYNTPEGVMAGYNVAKMTDKTFTDRISSIENTLKNKYNMTDEEIEDVKAGIYKGDVSTDLFERIRNIEIARKNFQDASDVTDKIIDIKTDTKDQQSGGGDGTFIGGGASLQDAGGTYDGGYHGAEGGFENTGPTGVDAGTADVQDYADIYANGGRVGLRYGGLLSIL
jgi:hypothetical protein